VEAGAPAFYCHPSTHAPQMMQAAKSKRYVRPRRKSLVSVVIFVVVVGDLQEKTGRRYQWKQH
jgi:hypothetical protein